MAKVKIDADGWVAHVYVDGEEVHGVSGYHIHHTTKTFEPKLALDFHVDELVYNGEDVDLTKQELRSEQPAHKPYDIEQILHNESADKRSERNQYFSLGLSTLIGSLLGILLFNLFLKFIIGV